MDTMEKKHLRIAWRSFCRQNGRIVHARTIRGLELGGSGLEKI